MNQEIIKQLISQHNVLRQNLKETADLLSSQNLDFKKIAEFLNTFEENLAKHLKLEDEVFYPKLLRLMKEKGMDVNKTRQFILEMDNIGSTIQSFLEGYKDFMAIEVNLKKFRIGFEHIVGILNIRIESEESGVYTYYDLF